jgi:mannosyltransferase
VVLTGSFHIVAIGVLPAHALLVWHQYQKSDRDVRLWKSLGALALIAAMVMPLAYAGSDQSSAIDWIQADVSAVVQMPIRLFGSYPVAAAIAGAALLAAVTPPFVSRRQVVVALLVWAIVPPVVTYVTFPLLHLFLYRYLLFTLPAWALLAASGLEGISHVAFRRAWPRALIAAVALPTLALLVLPPHHAARAPIPGEPDYRAAARIIAAGQRPDDGIVFSGTKRPPRMGMAYEMRNDARPADVLLAAPSEELGSYGATECAVALACLGQRERIWLVSTSYSDDPWSEMPKEKASALRLVFTVAQAQQLQRIHVYLLVRKRFHADGSGGS